VFVPGGGAERIDTVKVALSSGVVTLPWESRQALLLYLRRFEDARSVVAAFADAGTSRPVRLPADRKATLLVLVEAWIDELGDSAVTSPRAAGNCGTSCTTTSTSACLGKFGETAPDSACSSDLPPADLDPVCPGAP
jgi:hypothetical protein